MRFDQCLWIAVGGGLLTALCVSAWHGIFSASLPGFAFLSFVCALFLGLALACLRPVLNRPSMSTLAFLLYGTAAACFLDLYAMSATFDVFCPALRTDHPADGRWLGEPCSGWPIFVDFYYAAWPVSAGANLALWIAGVFAALLLWLQFRTLPGGELGD
jgi:hypothetical protein